MNPKPTASPLTTGVIATVFGTFFFVIAILFANNSRMADALLMGIPASAFLTAGFVILFYSTAEKRIIKLLKEARRQSHSDNELD